MIENFSNNVLLFVFVAIILAFCFSYLINSLLLKFSQNLGVRQNQTKDIRWSSTIKPSFGGISFFVIFLITFVLLSFLDDSLPIKTGHVKTLGVLIVCIMAFLMGLADDAYNTNPLLKFITQILCGLILYFTDTKILIFHSDFLNLSLTVLWVVGMMNSINMLDNMDAISTVTSLVILLFIVSLTINLNLIFTPIPILTLGLMGALLGFLIYNWHPSKMFMGDTGSQFLGAFISVLGIDYCWNSFTLLEHNWLSINPILLGFCSTILIFILPISDTATVTINRIRRGTSPFIGGKDHTTHHLYFKGLTEKRIALLFVTIGLISLTLALNLLLNFNTLWLITSMSFSTITFLSLYLVTVLTKK